MSMKQVPQRQSAPSTRLMPRFSSGATCLRRNAASLVRLFGEELRANKNALGRLVSIEVGKIVSEGLGEVQEMIDICDFAVGLSRQLHGLTIATERDRAPHDGELASARRDGIISAFNFPVAVWAWNAALALVCGNSIVWKPSEKTPLTALADRRAVQEARSSGLPKTAITRRRACPRC